MERPLYILPDGVFVQALLTPADDGCPASFSAGVGSLAIPEGFEGGCTLFARDHAVLRLPIRRGAESAPVTLTVPARVDLRVWAHETADGLAIRDHVANLNFVLNGANPGGVVFELTGIETPPTAAWDLIGHNCRNEDALRRSDSFRAGAVNVYYHAAPDVAARCCAAGDMIFLGTGSPLGRLTHEVGHALGLRGDGDGSSDRYDDGHPDALAEPNPFTRSNIMWRANASLRHHLTLGQIAWMHASERSVLARLGKLASVPTPPPRWADDHPDRTPRPAPEDLEAALAARFGQILAYWDDGRRPEGRPGSRSAADFVGRHLGRVRQ